MFGQSVLFVVLAIAVIIAVTDANTLLGGTPARHDELPYQVLVRHNNLPRCSGVIISERHVLTTATCGAGVSKSGLDIVTGSADMNKGQLHKIAVVTPHPLWKNGIDSSDDIAIIAIYGRFGKVYQNKINLPVAPAPCNAVATVSGWGLSPNNPHGFVLNLVKADTMTLCANRCGQLFRQAGQPVQIWSTNICSKKCGKNDLCMLDGGSPLVYRGTLIGIASWGYSCTAEWPQVFTSVYGYLGWIHETMIKT